jgi:hypothetical protein
VAGIEQRVEVDDPATLGEVRHLGGEAIWVDEPVPLRRAPRDRADRVVYDDGVAPALRPVAAQEPSGPHELTLPP